MLDWILSTGASLAGVGADFWSNENTNAQNAEQNQKNREFAAAEAQKARDWYSARDDYKYRRTMHDMKEAGLNPMLAYSQGAQSGGGAPQASAPGSIAAQSVQGTGDKLLRGASTALEAKRVSAELEQREWQNRATEESTHLMAAQRKQAINNARKADTEEKLVNAQLDAVRAEAKERIAAARAGEKSAEIDERNVEFDNTVRRLRNTFGAAGSAVDVLRPGIRLLPSGNSPGPRPTERPNVGGGVMSDDYYNSGLRRKVPRR